MSQQRFLAVAFTDGRTEQVLLFDPSGDSEQSAALLTDRLKENGWMPIKGSQRLLTRNEDGTYSPYVEERKPWITRALKLA